MGEVGCCGGFRGEKAWQNGYVASLDERSLSSALSTKPPVPAAGIAGFVKALCLKRDKGLLEERQTRLIVVG